ncbi:hypothetical protein POK33_35140 [Burkholderia cenocepacia]|uniref:hypothetical protein n=1 Tax=Burkholderia cenocepacia TaxID=95486 RepID=UPI0023B8A0A2|nr:hypothetical protein [Burkholderia cenocepacia]MDF0505985.1 hypothetical protein [Burkholderia cenocepacia]
MRATSLAKRANRHAGRDSVATYAGSCERHSRDRIDGVRRIGPSLHDALASDGRKFRGALFRANARLSYRMDDDWNDAARWNITKPGGASGRPDGREALELPD